MTEEKVKQLIEDALNSTSQMGIVNHFHNGWDSNQLKPEDALTGFPVYSVATASVAPTDTVNDGSIRFQVDGTDNYLWAYLNYNNAGVVTGTWKKISFATTSNNSAILWGLGSIVGSGLTFYFSSGLINATEIYTQIAAPQAGTISNLYINLSTAQSATGSLVFTMRKNGADTALTTTVAAGSSAGIFSDTTHSFTVVAGDLIDIKIVNNATANSGNIATASFKIS